MTPLSRRKTKLQFLTSDVVRERGKLRQVIVEAHPGYAVLRLQGLRTGLPISYEAVYMFAAKVAAQNALQEKKAKKKAGSR